MIRRRWVVLGTACGLVVAEQTDGKPGGVRALRVCVPGVGDLWWPARAVRAAGVREIIGAELALMVRGAGPDTL